MGLIIPLVITGILLALGLIVGQMAEKKHFSSLDAREEANRGIVQTQVGSFLVPASQRGQPSLVCSECVIASDYFKNFLSGFRKFFGGEMKSYNTLIERARREAIMRLVEQAHGYGYNAICNVRVEPVDITGNIAKKAAATVCVVASATAYHSDIQVQGLQSTTPPAPPVKPV
ncbi:MAG: heavy metal-binding domain-containing protein [Planctomycetota bacterium]